MSEELYFIQTGEIWYSPMRDRFGLLVRRKYYSVWQTPRQVGVYFEVDDRSIISYDDVRQAKHEDQWVKVGRL